MTQRDGPGAFSYFAAMRRVMLEGIPVTALGVELIIIAVWTVLSFALAFRWFRWS